MALGFLDNISPLVSLLANLRGQRQSNTAINQANVPTAAETQQNAIYQALLDPNSAMLQNATGQARAQNLSDFQQQLTEMQLADRRAGAMGHASTFFNPERADEAINYLTSRGLPQINALSQQQGRNQLVQAAQGLGSLQPAQQGRLNVQGNNALRNAATNSQVPPQILDILRSLGQQQTPMNSPQYATSASQYGPQLPANYRRLNGPVSI